MRRFTQISEVGVGERGDPQTYAIIGAAMEVHRQLGHGFLEPVYQEAMEAELEMRSIPAQREVVLPIQYKDRPLKCSYRADFICFDSVLLELKAQSALSPADEGQLINYLSATGLGVGLLINFGQPSLTWKRLALSAKSA